MLKAVLNEQEVQALAETVRDHYKKTDSGNYILDTEVKQHPDTLALRNAMHSEREEKEKLQKSLKAFEGVDPHHIADLKRSAELAMREKDVAAGKFDKALADATQELNSKLAESRKENEKLNNRVRQFAINDAALRAITEAGGNTKLLLPHILSVADLDDKGRPFIRGNDGKPLPAKNWQTVDDYKEIAEYVDDLRSDPDWAVAFKASGARGSNSQSTTTTQKRVGTVVERAGLNVYQ